MSTTAPEKIRSIAVIAHGGAGKTTLIETLLFQAHAISTRGSKDKGTAVMLTEPEEVSRKIAITPHVGHFTWNDTSVYLVDTPGYFNFLENTRGVLPGVDGAVVLFSGVEGVKPETERLWAMLEEAQVPVLGFVNQMDEENADFMTAITSINQALRVSVQPISIPIRAGASLPGIIDLIRLNAWSTKEGKSAKIEIPAAMQGDVNTLRTQLVEKIAEANDDLIEKYLEGAELTEEELDRGLKEAVLNRSFVPVLCGSGLNNVGVDALIEAIVRYLPSPLDRVRKRPLHGHVPDDETKELTLQSVPDAPFSAVTLKTTIDPFSGKLSVVRVYSGEAKTNQQVYNSTRKIKQKIGHAYLLQGKELVQVESLAAGQIGAFSKLDDTHTGDSLCDPDSPIEYPHVKFAEPPVAYAVEAEGKSEDKVGAGLTKLVDEDPTLHVYRDEQTHEVILAGMGQTHIEVAMERLTRKFGGKAKLKTPRVPYRETIRKSVKVHGKLKKQTGGHGQFANCWLEVGPQNRDAGFEFADQIVGGVIPKQWIPSIKKGVQEAMTKGILGGYPVVDVRVAVYDGSFHDVDSSDYAFQVAGSMAFKAGLEQASPVLLEPIMYMDIIVPEDTTGDVMKDISGRRGRVLNLNAKGEAREIEAEVPMAEVLDYGHSLSSMTSGRGTYTMSIASYKEVPQQIAEKVLAAAAKEKSE